MAILSSGQSLLPGQSLQSDSGVYTLTMQSDGNVVLYYNKDLPVWQTNTGGSVASEFIMQNDGNLVLYDASGHAYWDSKTQGNPGAFLDVQYDGNLVVYRAGSTSQTETANNALWASGTNAPLRLETVVASGATLNVGDADLSRISQDLITGPQATPGGVIISSWDPHTEQGSWSQVGPGGCSNPVTVTATIDANWSSGLGWTSSQLQDAFAGALLAVVQAVGNKTAYQNYSYTEVPAIGGDTVVCLDPQPLDSGHYIPPEIQITAYDDSGNQHGQVTATYSTGDQSGGSTCDILTDLGTVLAIFPPASELAAIVGAVTSLVCS